MSVRRDPMSEARRRGQWQLGELVRDLRAARLATGLSQRRVARALAVSHQLVSQWERGVGMPDPVRAVMWGSAVGLDVTFRSFLGGSPLRDAGQLRVLARARVRIGERWSWRTEAPVSRDPRDRRAVDAVIRRAGRSVGLEIITRLTDAQAQVRAALLKQQAAGLDRMVLILADSRHNRAAVAAATPTLTPAFPLRPRLVLRALQQGHVPASNGLVFV